MGVQEEDFSHGDEAMLNNEDEYDDLPKYRGNPSKRSKSSFQQFLAMGLSKPVFDGIKFADYKKPTPIQRAAIPVIRSGQDVVAMARTGSGKTAAFLIPLFERLKRHCPNQGPRALILEPTRELADQTLKFAKSLGRFTGLHCSLVVGGDKMDYQFDALHQHPDIIIATPGRLMHICVEMNLNLDKICYVVFDEADRLFELGFREQLEEILARLSTARQTLLFSATLPQMLAEFAKAGLTDPTLIRLDKDEKLSEQLQLGFLSISPEYKLHLLLYILQNVLQPSEQILIFAATQLEVQFLETLLKKLDLNCAFLYSDMDPSSRKINTAMFTKKAVSIMIATDIAARGIDIPNLDYVLNFNFPGSAKVFVHRVGRAARAGKCGVALSFVTPEEEPYLWDLHLFLGRSVKFSPLITESFTSRYQGLSSFQENPSWDYQFGEVPPQIFSDQNAQLKKLFHDDSELHYLTEKKDKAYKLYLKSRPKASKEALRELKEMRLVKSPGMHPFLLASVKRTLQKGGEEEEDMAQKRIIMLQKLKNIRPKKTIFEVGIKGSKTAGRMMHQKRVRDECLIAKHQQMLQEKRAKYDDMAQIKSKACQLPQMTDEDIFYEFPQSVTAQDDIQSAVTEKNKKIMEEEEQKQRQLEKMEKKKQKLAAKLASKVVKKVERDEKLANNVKEGFFIPYQPANHYSEKGYSVNASFAQQSKEAQLNLLEDDYKGLTRQKMIKKWDQKKEKFSGKKLEEKKIKTESGRIIRSSYKTDRYENWLKRNKIDKAQLEAGAGGDEDEETEEQVSEKKQAKGKERFKVLNARQKYKVHPLLAEHNKAMAEAGHNPKEEVRNEQQLKKHLKWQKRFAADRKKGEERKKMREKLNPQKTKKNAKKHYKPKKK